jgi:membrane protein DedA with SNARE-associated domain
LTEQLIGKLGYLGIALVLILGGLGLPIPEEAPIILAAVLTRNGQMTWPLAIGSCLAGVLLGDMVVYLLGFFYGEKVLRLPLTRRLLTRQREAQIKGYFHRHGFKILVSGRFVPGFRTAAYLTAGILKLPPVKLLLTDLVAASLSTLLMFGLGYFCAYQIQNGGIREVQLWVTVVVALSIALWVLYRYYRAQKSSGLPVGPPVLDLDQDPLSIADLASVHRSKHVSNAPAADPADPPAPPRQDVAATLIDPRPGESGGRPAVAAPAVTDDRNGMAIDVSDARLADNGLPRAEEEIGVREL